MGKTAITFGILLVILGLAGYFGTATRSFTALIPTAFGILLVVAGTVANRYPRAKMHAMHAAVLIAMFGLVASGVKAISALMNQTFKASVASQLLMAGLCAVFVALSVRSFINARRQRVQGIEGAPGESL